MNEIWVRGASASWIAKLSEVFSVETLDCTLVKFLEKDTTGLKAIIFFLESDGLDLSGIKWGLNFRFKYKNVVGVPIIYLSTTKVSELCKRYPKANFVNAVGCYFLERPTTKACLVDTIQKSKNLQREDLVHLMYFAQAEIRYLNETLAHEMKNRTGALVLMQGYIVNELLREGKNQELKRWLKRRIKDCRQDALKKTLGFIYEQQVKNNRELEFNLEMYKIFESLETQTETIWNAYAFVSEIKAGNIKRTPKTVDIPQIKKQILLIDDQAERGQWSYVLQQIFGSEKIHTYFPPNGDWSEAAEEITDSELQKYDLVLLDLWLEKGDQEESSYSYIWKNRRIASDKIASRIRKKAPQVPILAFSAFDNVMNYRKILENGVFDLYTKPGISELNNYRISHYSFAVLLKKIKNILELNKTRFMYKEHNFNFAGASDQEQRNVKRWMNEAWFLMARAQFSRASLFNFFVKTRMITEYIETYINAKDPRIQFVNRMRSIATHTGNQIVYPCNFLSSYDAIICYYFLSEALECPQHSICRTLDFYYIREICDYHHQLQLGDIIDSKDGQIYLANHLPAILLVYIFFYQRMQNENFAFIDQDNLQSRLMQSLVDKRLRSCYIEKKDRKITVNVGNSLLSCVGDFANSQGSSEYLPSQKESRWPRTGMLENLEYNINLTLHEWSSSLLDNKNVGEQCMANIHWNQANGFCLEDIQYENNDLHLFE